MSLFSAFRGPLQLDVHRRLRGLAGGQMNLWRFDVQSDRDFSVFQDRRQVDRIRESLTNFGQGAFRALENDKGRLYAYALQAQGLG